MCAIFLKLSTAAHHAHHFLHLWSDFVGRPDVCTTTYSSWLSRKWVVVFFFDFCSAPFIGRLGRGTWVEPSGSFAESNLHFRRPKYLAMSKNKNANTKEYTKENIKNAITKTQIQSLLFLFSRPKHEWKQSALKHNITEQHSKSTFKTNYEED